jgi:hypothetical protein
MVLQHEGFHTCCAHELRGYHYSLAPTVQKTVSPSSVDLPESGDHTIVDA